MLTQLSYTEKKQNKKLLHIFSDVGVTQPYIRRGKETCCTFSMMSVLHAACSWIILKNEQTKNKQTKTTTTWDGKEKRKKKGLPRFKLGATCPSRRLHAKCPCAWIRMNFRSCQDKTQLSSYHPFSRFLFFITPPPPQPPPPTPRASNQACRWLWCENWQERKALSCPQPDFVPRVITECQAESDIGMRAH